MSLQPGQIVSHFRIVEKIGEGGMGEVYRASDTRLNRDVAIKVLPAEVANDAERMARFEREAQFLAALHHPNIAVIHGLDEVDGTRLLVMELVAGQDLLRRLQQGPMPVEEALETARQIADALEGAHEQGVIHRDLKPANIQITPDGTVKILDFGLAKAFDTVAGPASAASLSPTLTTPATRAGMIMGTAAYMSPEQAKGRPVDRRADIWSFGCVLFEMLAGHRPFRGDGVSETLASVIMSAPPLESLPSSTPPAVRRLLQRCLEKDARRRLRDIGEARIVLEETLAGKGEPAVAAVEAAAVKSRGVRPGLAIAAAALLALLAAGLAWTFKPGAPSPPLRRFALPDEAPGRTELNASPMAISPDGSRIAYAVGGKLWIRPLDTIQPKEITVASAPGFVFWSPDSRWVGYSAGTRLWKAPAEGGEAAPIGDVQGQLDGGSGAAWTRDGRIVFSRGHGALYEMPALGGDVKQILEVDKATEADFHQPSPLPDGSLLLTVHVKEGRPDTLQVLQGGKRKTILRIEGQDIWDAAYSPTGHVLFRRQPANPGIWAFPFSVEKHERTGEPFLVVPDGDLPSVSDDGTLVHVTASGSRLTQLVWVDRKGTVLGKIGPPQEQWPFPALSPDQRRIAISASEGEAREVWIHDVERGTASRLTFGARSPFDPSWSPDGKQVLYSDNSFEMKTVAADGGGEAKSLGRGWGPVMSPDGRTLLYTENEDATEWNIRVQDLSPPGEPHTLVGTARWQIWPRLSPDQRWMAYVSDEAGAGDEIYVKPYPSGEGKWQVSVGGGNWPRWSHDGRSLFYVKKDTFYEVEVKADATLHLGAPRELFTRRPFGRSILFGWPTGFDVSADGQRFVVLEPVDPPEKSRPSIVVTESWLSPFRRKS